MRYLSFLLLATLVPLSAFALRGDGNEVGGNGNAIAAFFVRAGYVLARKMEEKEAVSPPYVKEFPAAKFKSVLATRVVVLDQAKEALLTNEFGEVMEIKVIADSATKKPIILVRGRVWSDYLQKRTPDYRVALHAYLYAAGLDDSVYQYSSLVPIESLGLTEILPDEPTFHEFERSFALRGVKRYEGGIVGVTADKKKVLHFNLNGLLTWEYEKAGRRFTFASKHWDDTGGILAAVEGEPAVIELRLKDGSYRDERTYPGAPDIVGMDAIHILRKALFMFYPLESDGNHFSDPHPLPEHTTGTNVVRSRFLNEWAVTGYTEKDGKRHPYTAIENFSVYSPHAFFSGLEGEFAALDFASPDRIYAGGFALVSGVKRPYLGGFSRAYRGNQGALDEDERRFLPLMAGDISGRVTGVACGNDTVFASVNLETTSGKKARVYAWNRARQELKTKDLPDAEITSLLYTEDGRILISTSDRLLKFAMP